MKINRFGVVGAGQMGSGIAQVAATAGLEVVMSDIQPELCEKGIQAVSASLDRMVNKETIDLSQKEDILGRISTTTRLADMASIDFVVEAATEKEELKFKIFEELDKICSPSAILASNTSSIPIGRIASKTSRQDKVIGMHFMNPVPLMKLVEVINGIGTSQQTFEITWKLCEALGKTPARANDFPGFIANRILMPMINEAVFCLYENVGRAKDIDTVMQLGMNHPLGPLALADLIGLDTCLAIMETLYNGFKDSKYRPCPLLGKYVEAGWLGRKTKKGFYDYN